MRREGVVLVARKDGEYWFISSVFRHDAGLFGCTGMAVYPVSKEQAEEALSVDSLEERFGDYWEEYAKDRVCSDCRNCRYGLDEDGCEDCGYQSLRKFCKDIAENGGLSAVFDSPGCEYEEALRQLSCDVKTADCSSCGRIFGNGVGPDDFDEVYNRAALDACLAYEAGAIDYDSAVHAIFGD